MSQRRAELHRRACQRLFVKRRIAAEVGFVPAGGINPRVLQRDDSRVEVVERRRVCRFLHARREVESEPRVSCEREVRRLVHFAADAAEPPLAAPARAFECCAGEVAKFARTEIRALLFAAEFMQDHHAATVHRCEIPRVEKAERCADCRRFRMFECDRRLHTTGSHPVRYSRFQSFFASPVR